MKITLSRLCLIMVMCCFIAGILHMMGIPDIQTAKEFLVGITTLSSDFHLESHHHEPTYYFMFIVTFVPLYCAMWYGTKLWVKLWRWSAYKEPEKEECHA